MKKVGFFGFFCSDKENPVIKSSFMCWKSRVV